jgi:hypothetical protein
LLKFIYALRNSIDYPLRQFFHWKRSGLIHKNEEKSNIFFDLPQGLRPEADQTATYLFRTYHLDYLYQHSSIQNYRQNLYYLELLDKALSQISSHLPPQIVAADIGVSDWFYAQALFGAVSYWQYPKGRSIILEGYEADAYRVYDDLFSRMDYATVNISSLEGVQFIPKMFAGQSAKYDLITLFFPFIYFYDHLLWGLPSYVFNPIDLLEKAWRSLKMGGLLLIVNQGENEHKAQIELLSKLGITRICGYQHSSILYSYAIARFVTIARRDG